jgi:hypothetical protein
MEAKKQPGRRNKNRASKTQHSINTVAHPDAAGIDIPFPQRTLQGGSLPISVQLVGGSSALNPTTPHNSHEGEA